MDLEEQLQLIEHVCLAVCFTLHQYRKGNMDCGKTIVQIRTELQKLEQLKDESCIDYLLTKIDFGPPAYLKKCGESGWFVEVGGQHVTGTYPESKTALDEYVTQCESDDFIFDFLQGLDTRTCRYGENKYAYYVQKCFDTYRIGREL